MINFRTFMQKKNTREYVASLIIIIAFLFGWFLVYGNSVFFNPKHVMDQRGAVSNIDPIGADLALTLANVNAFREDKSPYLNTTFYPPLTILMHLPLTRIPFERAYFYMSVFTICALFLSLIIVDRIVGNRAFVPFILAFFLFTAYFSYGLQFELERGQFSIIAIFICVTSLLFFYYNKKILASLLFSISVNLKIYPIIFVLLFFKYNLREKKNILFIVGTLLLSFAELFILGDKFFRDFINAFIYNTSNTFIWAGNHSLFAYCTPQQPGQGFCDAQSYPFALGFYFLLVISAVIITWRKKLSRYNAYIFALAGIGTLLVPSMSNDYKLSIMAIILLPLFKEIYVLAVRDKKYINLLLLALLTFFYTLTLFTFNYASFPFSQNKAPVLYALAILTMIAMLINTYSVHTISLLKQLQCRLAKM